MKFKDITESSQKCPHCGGPLVEYSGLMEKKDACYYKVKASAKVWPSAYASGRLVQCRKKGAANYGNKSESVAEGADDKFSVADKVEELVRNYKLFDERGWTDLFSKLAGKKLYGQEYKAEIYRAMEYASKFLQLLDSIRMRSDYRGQQDPKKDQELIDLSNQWLDLFNKATSEYKAMSGQGVAEGGAKDRQWSNKDMEKLRVATRDFDDILSADGPDAFKQELIKKRIKTKPMAGPKGVLPEQGVTENTKQEILFYAKIPDGSRVYARVKDAEQLGNLQQQYRGAEIKTFDYNRPDILDWLEARGINLRKFTPGMVQTMYPGSRGHPGSTGLNEFAPGGSGDDGNDGFSDDTLKRLAAQWWNGDEDPKVEQTLLTAGWEIGQDEGYDDEPGVFVVQAGDINGNSYMSWSAEELKGLVESLGNIKMNEKYNPEYDDEAGMADNNLQTLARAVEGIDDLIQTGDNLPEWCQEKIAVAKSMLVAVWDYMYSEEASDEVDPEIDAMFEAMDQLVHETAHAQQLSVDLVWESFESLPDHMLYETAAWRRKEGKSKKGGLNAKGVASYRRENPGSKLQMAVTTKPSKLKPGSKAAKRRKSFCARMSGVKGPMKKPNGKPTRKALALRKWNC